MKKKVIVCMVNTEDVVKYLCSSDCNACVEFISWSNGEYVFEVVDNKSKIKDKEFIKDSCRLNFSDDDPKMTNLLHLDFKSLLFNVVSNPELYKHLILG